jgi:hypothetical protein
MGQWVDLDILHKFYPINKSKEELRAYLLELERGNFLKPTDTEGVWECNMVGGWLGGDGDATSACYQLPPCALIMVHSLCCSSKRTCQ